MHSEIEKIRAELKQKVEERASKKKHQHPYMTKSFMRGWPG